MVFGGFGGPSLVCHVLRISRTGPGSDPSKKGNRTRTRLDFKALFLNPSQCQIEMDSIVYNKFSCVSGDSPRISSPSLQSN